MDVFSELDINSPVTSTVISSSDLVATVESALQFDSGHQDFGMEFFDYRKEGYEDSQVYDMGVPPDSGLFSGLPPYPGDGLESHSSSMASPSSTSSSMASSSLYQPPPSPYQRTPSTFSLINESNKKRDKRSASSDEPFPAADSNSGSSSKSFVACKVCGDKASGYHYGVTSCEGCKGFFRRSIQKQIDYKCLRDKQCLVIRLNRNRCQYCRFRKCLDVGMSKDSVRYGRVPKKSREKIEDNRVSQSENEKPPPPTFELKQNMYDIIVSISDAYLAHCAYTEARTRGLVRKPALFSMTDQQHSAVEGGNSLELQKIVMWQQFASFLTPSVQQVVEFAKRIPGFHDLGQDDKLLCIKLGFFEVWLVHASRLISPQESTITFSDGSFVSRQQMEIMFDREFVNLMFNFVHCFNELQLSDAEIALYSTVVLVTAEREGIYDHKSVQQLQEQMIAALKHQVLESHPSSGPQVLATLLSKVQELRAIGEKHLEHLRWFRANWAHLRIPALFAEVFDIPRQHDHDLAQR